MLEKLVTFYLRAGLCDACAVELRRGILRQNNDHCDVEF